MAGIYIHIPFCKRKCHYCDFFSSASLKKKDDLVAAMLTEIRLQKHYLKNETISTIYIGGGTPSLLEPQVFHDIFYEIEKYYIIDDDVEFTLEANPDDLSREKLTMIRDTPVNRLSIGVQSFNNKDLKYLNRVHDKDQALTAIEETLKAGFDNVSVDLIYGIPGQHEERWSKNLDILAGLCIPHISAYALTVEPGTILDNRISKNKKIQPDEDLSIIHFKRLMSFMGEKGYIHYEISNFCKKGFHSLHNSNYWFGKKYLGIGPSAHSFNIDQRQWNVANISTYIDRLKNEIIPFQKETLSTEQMFNEYLMISLRTIQGCDLNYIKKTFGKSFYRHCIRESGAYLDKGFLRLENEKLFLTIEGKLFADRIASDMFFAE